MRSRSVLTLAAVTVALASSLACGGKTEEEKAAEKAKEAVEKAAQDTQKASQQAQKGAEQVSDSAKEMAKGLEALGRGLGAMAAGAADAANQKPVDPVSFRDLQTVFPDLSGWEKGKPTGERLTAPFAYSQAEVAYTKGDARIRAKIVDSGFNQLLITPFQMFLVAGYEKETSNGYEKAVKIGDAPALEKWNSESKDGELTVIVARRFIVTFEGDNLPDAKALSDAASKADLAKLASMK
jgi:hypothetical protein